MTGIVFPTRGKWTAENGPPAERNERDGVVRRRTAGTGDCVRRSVNENFGSPKSRREFLEQSPRVVFLRGSRSTWSPRRLGNGSNDRVNVPVAAEIVANFCRFHCVSRNGDESRTIRTRVTRTCCRRTTFPLTAIVSNRPFRAGVTCLRIVQYPKSDPSLHLSVYIYYLRNTFVRIFERNVSCVALYAYGTFPRSLLSTTRRRSRLLTANVRRFNSRRTDAPLFRVRRSPCNSVRPYGHKRRRNHVASVLSADSTVRLPSPQRR